MFRFVLCLAGCCLFANAQESPYKLTIYPQSTKDYTTAPAQSFVGAIKCDGARVISRGYKRGDVYGAPVDILDTRGSQALSIDVTTVSDKAASKPKSLKSVDFAASNSVVYITAVNEDEIGYVLKFSSSDGSFRNAVRLEDGFYPAKLAAFDSGAFVIVGTRRSQKNAAGTNDVASSAYLYDANGQVVKELGLPKSEHAGGKSEDILRLLSLSLMEGSHGWIYLLQPGAQPLLHILQEDGTLKQSLKLWSPGEKFVPMNLRVSDTSALVEYVQDPDKDGRVIEFVQYDVTRNEPVAIHEKAPELIGAFACFDWGQNYTFLTNRNGHRAVITATAR